MVEVITSQNTDKETVIYSSDTSHLHKLATCTHGEGGSLATNHQSDIITPAQTRTRVLCWLCADTELNVSLVIIVGCSRNTRQLFTMIDQLINTHHPKKYTCLPFSISSLFSLVFFYFSVYGSIYCKSEHLRWKAGPFPFFCCL